MCVIRDLSKLDEKGCLGAPDLIIEILSFGNSKKDLTIKFDLYEKSVFIYVLKDGKYYGSRPYIMETEIQSPTFPELKFAVDKIFEE